MRRASCIAMLTGALLSWAGPAADEKGTVIDFDGLKATAPATWTSEKPSTKIRFAQFRLKGKNTEDAELVIFKGLGGSAQSNVARWKQRFIPPEGKTIEDVAKVSSVTIGGMTAMQLEISGTFKFKADPTNPNSKEERKRNYKMVAIQFDGPENVYHIMLIGPAKTVDEHREAFDNWRKAFMK